MAAAAGRRQQDVENGVNLSTRTGSPTRVFVNQLFMVDSVVAQFVLRRFADGGGAKCHHGGAA